MIAMELSIINISDDVYFVLLAWSNCHILLGIKGLVFIVFVGLLHFFVEDTF